MKEYKNKIEKTESRNWNSSNINWNFLLKENFSVTKMQAKLYENKHLSINITHCSLIPQIVFKAGYEKDNDQNIEALKN